MLLTVTYSRPLVPSRTVLPALGSYQIDETYHSHAGICTSRASSRAPREWYQMLLQLLAGPRRAHLRKELIISRWTAKGNCLLQSTSPQPRRGLWPLIISTTIKFLAITFSSLIGVNSVPVHALLSSFVADSGYLHVSPLVQIVYLACNKHLTWE